MKQLTGSKLRKEYVKAVCCHPAYLTYMQSTSCMMPGWMNHKLQSRLLGEISVTSNMQINTTRIVENEEKLKRLLLRVKEESEKTGLKLNIQKTKIMASSPINPWQIEGEKLEAVTGFLFLDSSIAEDGDCSHQIKRCLLLGRKVMTNLDGVLKAEVSLCQQRSI